MGAFVGEKNFDIDKGLRSQSHRVVGVLVCILVNRLMMVVLTERCC